MRVTCVGSGDAFGSGGRLNTCYAVETAGLTILLDCGVTSLVGLKRVGLDPAAVDVIVCTHLHGDHVGGLPFLVLGAQVARPRTRLPTVVGPRGISGHYDILVEAMFPGSPRADKPRFIEYQDEATLEVFGLRVSTAPVRHREETNPHAVRLEVDGRTVAYTGDTEWVPELSRIADGADLLICECLSPEPYAGHLDLRTLRERRHELRCGRILLTHLDDDMLALRGSIEFECAEDGMVIDLP